MTLFDRPIATETYAAIRFGTGFPTRGAPVTAESILARVQGPDHIGQRFGQAGFAETTRLHRTLLDARKAFRADKKGAEERLKAQRKQNAALRFATLATDLARAVDSDDPLRERLQWFWTNHFATQPRNTHLRTVQGGYVQEAIRPHMTGRFSDLLKAAITHPMLLLSLNQIGSIGPNSVVGVRYKAGLNENLARELIELHTMGVGAGYSQTDVTELAELLTGMHYSIAKGESFNPLMAEPGAEQVLGVRYGNDGLAQEGDIHAVLEDLAAHPATATHISRKLAVHFVADKPDPDLVEHMAQAYRLSDGDLVAVYAALLEHPAAWRDFGAKIKMPLDYVASALRALGMSGKDIIGLKTRRVKVWFERPMRLMGQPFNEPPGPDGFPERAEAWVQPYGLAARIAWAMEAVKCAPDGPPDPRRFVMHALGDVASARLIWAAGAAETRIDGVGIVLSSAEFNRR